MPHVSGGGGVDLSSNDEIKVFRVEGEGEDEERSSSENLKEVKNSLVAEVPEQEEKSVQISSQSFLPSKNSHLPRSDLSSLTGKPFEYLPPSPFGYVVSPYHPHANGALGALSMFIYLLVVCMLLLSPLTTEQVNRVPMVSPNHVSQPLPLMMYNPEAFQPPPAHMGISPVHIDPKTGLTRSPVYPLSSPGQYHPVFSPDFTQQFQWPHGSMYSMASGFRPPPYPGTIPISSASISSKFSPTLLPPHPGLSPGISHHPLLGPGPKIEMPDSQDSRHLPNFSHHNHHQSSNSHPVNNNNTGTSQPLHHSNVSQNPNSMGDNSSARARSEQKKKNHIKKPLNAFMLYMKEMRSQVVAECTLKESAAINQILGRRWHNLTREQQAKYYEMARKERQLHMQLYPGWTARDNYAINAKKKKRKRDKSQEGDGNNPKKCRARFGLDQQSSWCKPCRRKKKCIRYISGSDNTGESEDNIGSVGSLGSEAPTPDSRFDMDSSQLTDEDSGNGDIDDELEVSSEFSLSSPPVETLSPPVPRSLDNVQSILENGRSLVGSPPSQQIHHPLNVQHLSRSSGHHPPTDSPEGNLPQLPTPPSTDSSTTTVGIAVT